MTYTVHYMDEHCWAVYNGSALVKTFETEFEATIMASLANRQG